MKIARDDDYVRLQGDRAGSNALRRAPCALKHTPSNVMPMQVDAADAASTAAEVLAALSRMHLLAPGETPTLVPLTGGVSSEILRVDLSRGSICTKRALAKLRVEADWRAPIERSRWEVEWLKLAGEIVPGSVPRVLAVDPDGAMFAMEYLDPAHHPVWKSQLRDGAIAPAFAAEVGRRLALIHARTAGREDVAARFQTDHIFFPIRLEPYLHASARAHPDCGVRLEALAQITATTKLALVHGDVSPKNILCSNHGPMFLDAECAWFGDPAFDLGFCLNHLLLKCLWRPQWIEPLLACYGTLAQAYLHGVAWEAPARIEARTAHLLPGLLLGRVDGKSPVEYLSAHWQRDHVRQIARRYLLAPVDSLADIASHWRQQLTRSATSSALRDG